MFKNLTREAVLAIRAKSGLTPGLFIGLAFAVLALLTAFALLCVAAYVWLAGLFGGIFAALIGAGFFLLVAALSAIFAAVARSRARQRAMLERAARAGIGAWLFDPKILSTVLEVGRSLGWQRLAAMALLGFLAAQWTRERRDDKDSDSDSD